jgi:hypothetical protein
LGTAAFMLLLFGRELLRLHALLLVMLLPMH